MEGEFYRFYVHDSIARKDVERLISIWRDAALMGEEGEEYRQMITDAIPDLAEWHDVRSTYGATFRERDVAYSFRKFVEAYDKMILEEKYPNVTPKWQVFYQAIEKNNRRVIDHYFNKGYVSETAIKIAIEQGNLKLVRLFWLKEKESIESMRDLKGFPDRIKSYEKWELGKHLLTALEQDDAEIFAYFYELRNPKGTPYYEAVYVANTEHYDVYWYDMKTRVNLFEESVAKGKFAVAAYLYEKKPKYSWLKYAARSGSWDFVNFFLQKGADDYSDGLIGAAESDRMEMILFFMDLGANTKEDMDTGLYFAALAYNIKLMDFFVEHGANDFRAALKHLRRKWVPPSIEKEKTIDYLMQLISEEDFTLLEEEERLEEEEKRAQQAERERLEQERLEREERIKAHQEAVQRVTESRRLQRNSGRGENVASIHDGGGRGGGRGGRGRGDGGRGRGGRGEGTTAVLDASGL